MFFALAQFIFSAPHAQAKEDGARPGANAAIPVTAAIVQQQAMPVWLDVQGTVTPRNYVNVMPRVAGLLKSVNFQEGQPVKSGQLLATIDPHPYQIQVDLAKAQLSRDRAQLAGAESDLARYETLLLQDSISSQQVMDQRATVGQLKGTVAADISTLDNASLQLAWTRITAPIAGIVGLRQVDVGNMVGTGGAIGGGNSALTSTTSSSLPIVTIAQVQPITVTFAVAQNQLPLILERMRGATLPVQAWNQNRTIQLDSGKLIAVDNQINSSTGTVMLKAEFPNLKMSLYPNQFVNVRLLVNTIDAALLLPSSAVATGTSGSYVYVIDSDDKVAARKVTTGLGNQDVISINAGLKVGERVVNDGLDRLKDGSKVQVVVPANNSTPENTAAENHKRGDRAGAGHDRKPAQ